MDKLYKLSNICDFDVDLVFDKEHHHNYYRFAYNTQNTENDFDTTTYIFLAFNSNDSIDSKNLAIVFNQITLGERDYPYGKITTYFFDGTIETRYYDYNEINDTKKSDSYIKQLVKK